MRKRSLRTIETDVFGYPVAENPINSKKKGDRNERTAAGWLYQWTGVKFIRTPSSGGRRLVNAPNFCGDVVCEDLDFNFPFAVETKHLKSITFTKKLRSNSVIFSIFEQAQEDARRAKKHPMMILRKDKMAKGEYIIFFTFDVGIEYDCFGTTQDGVDLYGYDSSKILKRIKFVDVVKIL